MQCLRGQHILRRRPLRHLRWQYILSRRLLRQLLRLHLLRRNLLRRRIVRRLRSKSEALLTRLVKIGRQLRALFYKIESVLERVDEIDVLVASDCPNLAKRSASR